MVIAITGTPSRADCLAFVDPSAYRLALRLKRACPPSRRALDLVLKRNKNGMVMGVGVVVGWLVPPVPSWVVSLPSDLASLAVVAWFYGGGALAGY
jgi:hypothetical protein